jgi:hypothetical protein
VPWRKEGTKLKKKNQFEFRNVYLYDTLLDEHIKCEKMDGVYITIARNYKFITEFYSEKMEGKITWA